ncbi:hypothetical protein BGZ70_002603 [Mortierella alpina]|uniref:Uncharacterized protein n=1 Tax=Mortierella alpina TaxID=64518 RepID=A0A9P6IX09_MORAP|nr:hypothetical protein BGZ70_002603 [Mortierella alpina]
MAILFIAWACGLVVLAATASAGPYRPGDMDSHCPGPVINPLTTIAPQTDFVPVTNVQPVINVLPTDYNDYSCNGNHGGDAGLGGQGGGYGGWGWGNSWWK